MARTATGRKRSYTTMIARSNNPRRVAGAEWTPRGLQAGRIESLLMATYASLAATPGGSWQNVVGATAAPINSNSYDIADSDGTTIEVVGNGFTYAGNTVTGGTITELIRYSGMTNMEAVTGLSVAATTFMAQAIGSAMFALVYAGDDVFNDSFLNAMSGSINGYAGTNTLNLSVSANNDYVELTLTNGTSSAEVYTYANQVKIAHDDVSNIQDFSSTGNLFVQDSSGSGNNNFTGQPALPTESNFPSPLMGSPSTSRRRTT
jgi:hypothetical protein